MKLPLEQAKKGHPSQINWISCSPFVENSRGTLIHRPREGRTYNIHKQGRHVSISFWCGMSCSSSGKNFTFLDAPPEGKILCEKCEVNAVLAGIKSADELAGRHVHKGRTKAVVTCCKLGESHE